VTRIAILGAGPAGLGAALGAARRGHKVTVIERSAAVGGNAGSFELAGLPVDYGSHRFHPAADPDVLGLVRSLLGDDLLERPRHGRIRLRGRWVHFPLRAADLALRIHPAFGAGVARDLVAKALAGHRADRDDDTFASVLDRGLGRTICRDFYFPYARKIWGLEPTEISPIQARRRVSSGTIGKLLGRILPGKQARGPKSIFYYPRRGFGQISEALRDAAARSGATFRMNSEAARIVLSPDHAQIEIRAGESLEALTVDHVWSTIPVTALARIVSPSAPADAVEAARRLELRAMLLVYLVLETPQFTEFDAHYFPEQAFPFTRISEPKNYSDRVTPAGQTVLCAEIPCAATDPIWSLSETELGERVREGLAHAGLPVSCPVSSVEVKRLPAAYPIYRRGYEAHFSRLDGWVDTLPHVVTFGRQGLYAHDNTHHALAMAQAAVACLDQDGRFSREAWAGHRRRFESHVVED
jgi:protoporphyrinogen oxidase